MTSSAGSAAPSKALVIVIKLEATLVLKSSCSCIISAKVDAISSAEESKINGTFTSISPSSKTGVAAVPSVNIKRYFLKLSLENSLKLVPFKEPATSAIVSIVF